MARAPSRSTMYPVPWTTVSPPCISVRCICGREVPCSRAIEASLSICNIIILIYKQNNIKWYISLAICQQQQISHMKIIENEIILFGNFPLHLGMAWVCAAVCSACVWTAAYCCWILPPARVSREECIYRAYELYWVGDVSIEPSGPLSSALNIFHSFDNFSASSSSQALFAFSTSQLGPIQSSTFAQQRYQ